MNSTSSHKKKFVSVDEIKNLYQKTGRMHPAYPQEVVLNNSSQSLTASTQFVIKEAKKLISSFNERTEVSSLPSEQDVEEIVRQVERGEGEELSVRERTSAVSALMSSLDHYDILSGLVENSEVNDIIIKSYKDISIQIGRRNIQTDLKFPDFDTYKAFVERLLKRAGKACTVAQPIVDASIDPTVRASVTHESISPGDAGPMLTLRISRHASISLDGLQVVEFAPAAVLDYLSHIVRSGCGAILIGGEVGTGKTTLVRALSNLIDETEAILVIEDTNEINLKRKFVRSILTREGNIEGFGLVTPAQAIRAGMRMAMNRVILGEIRDGQAAEAFIDVCSSGHAGMSTIHAKSARDVISRLELFLARAQGDVGINTIRKQIANAISVVVYIGLDSVTKKRRIVSVMEVEAAADGVVQMAPIFTLDSTSGKAMWKRGGGISKFQEMLNDSNYKLPKPGALV